MKTNRHKTGLKVLAEKHRNVHYFGVKEFCEKKPRKGILEVLIDHRRVIVDGFNLIGAETIRLNGS